MKKLFCLIMLLSMVLASCSDAIVFEKDQSLAGTIRPGEIDYYSLLLDNPGQLALETNSNIKIRLLGIEVNRGEYKILNVTAGNICMEVEGDAIPYQIWTLFRDTCTNTCDIDTNTECYDHDGDGCAELPGEDNVEIEEAQLVNETNDENLPEEKLQEDNDELTQVEQAHIIPDMPRIITEPDIEGPKYIYTDILGDKWDVNPDVANLDIVAYTGKIWDKTRNTLLDTTSLGTHKNNRILYDNFREKSPVNNIFQIGEQWWMDTISNPINNLGEKIQKENHGTIGYFGGSALKLIAGIADVPVIFTTIGREVVNEASFVITDTIEWGIATGDPISMGTRFIGNTLNAALGGTDFIVNGLAGMPKALWENPERTLGQIIGMKAGMESFNELTNPKVKANTNVNEYGKGWDSSKKFFERTEKVIDRAQPKAIGLKEAQVGEAFRSTMDYADQLPGIKTGKATIGEMTAAKPVYYAETVRTPIETSPELNFRSLDHTIDGHPYMQDVPLSEIRGTLSNPINIFKSVDPKTSAIRHTYYGHSQTGTYNYLRIGVKHGKVYTMQSVNKIRPIGEVIWPR